MFFELLFSDKLIIKLILKIKKDVNKILGALEKFVYYLDIYNIHVNKKNYNAKQKRIMPFLLKHLMINKFDPIVKKFYNLIKLRSTEIY